MSSSSLSLKNKNLIWFGILAALTLWQLPVFYLLFAAPVIDGSLTKNASGCRPILGDFVNFYYAGSISLLPERSRAYDVTVQEGWRSRVVPLELYPANFHVDYMPFVFPLMIPLTVLPIGAAYIAWGILTLAFGAWAIFILAKSTGLFETKHIAVFILILISSYPSLHALRNGQATWLLLGLACFYFYSLIKGFDVLAGLTLALSSIKPHYALIWALPPLAAKRWRLLTSAVICEILLLMLGAITIGWQTVINYPAMIRDGETNPNYWGVFPDYMVSLRSLFYFIFPGKLGLDLSLFASVLGAVFVLWLWIIVLESESSRLRAFSQNVRWAIALTIVITLFISPHTYVYDTLFLAISALFTLPIVDEKSRKQEVIWATKIWYLLLFSYPLVSGLFYVNLQLRDLCKGYSILVILFLLVVTGLIKLSSLIKRQEWAD